MTDKKSQTFEEAFEQLKAIVESLDSKREGGLDVALTNYEQGMALLKMCREKLEGVHRRIQVLQCGDEQNEPELEAVDEDNLRVQSSDGNIALRQDSLSKGLNSANRTDANAVPSEIGATIGRKRVAASASKKTSVRAAETRSLLDEPNEDEESAEKKSQVSIPRRKKDASENELPFDRSEPPF